MTKTHLATAEMYSLLENLTSWSLLYFKTIKTPGVNLLRPHKIHNMPAALDEALPVDCLCTSVYTTENGFSWALAVVLYCWQALCFTRHRGQKHWEDRLHPSLGLLFRSRPQGKIAEQTEHTDIRDTELPAHPTALSFITAATDATSLSTSNPSTLPSRDLYLVALLHISTSQSCHPNSALQCQTNTAIWSKTRKDHRRIFSHNVLFFFQPAVQPTHQNARNYCNIVLYQLRKEYFLS